MSEQTALETGVWFENKDFYRYNGKSPIVVEASMRALFRQSLRQSPVKKYFVFHGCISCQLRQLGNHIPNRWMILPP